MPRPKIIPLQKQSGPLFLNVFARKNQRRPATDLNQHCPSDEFGNPEEIWVRRSVTTNGPASRSGESRNSDYLFCSEISISGRNRKFKFARPRCSAICGSESPQSNFLRIRHWDYADSSPWPGAITRFFVRKHSERTSHFFL